MKGLIVCAAAAALFLNGCAAVAVPPNVAVNTRSDGAGTVRSIDFSYQATRPPEFKRLKLCVAENVMNDAVTLQGGDQILATRWGIFQHGDSETIPAGQVFKYADDDNQVLIVSGNADGGSDPLGVVHYSLRFQLRADVRGQRVGLVFKNIAQAQQDTGSMANNGYSPVGTWAGGRAMKAYGSLETVADSIKSCVGA